MTILTIINGYAELLIASAGAQWSNPCTLVPGPCGTYNLPYAFILPAIRILTYSIGGLSVVFCMWGGFQMILSYGDEGKISQGRMSIFYALLGFCVAALSQSIAAFVAAQAADAAASGQDVILGAIGELADTIALFFDVGLGVAIIIAGYRFVISRGESGEFENAKRMAVWAIAGGVLINLSNALVQAAINFFI